MKSGIIFFIFSIIFSIKTVLCVDFAFYCKCYCPPNSTIVKVKDCSVCNKNLCIEQRLCVFQNSTTSINTNSTTSNRPRSIQELDQYRLVKSSLVTYTEYLYASLFGRVKRDFMINENELTNKEKRKIEKNEDNESNNKDEDGKEENDKKDDEKEENNKDNESKNDNKDDDNKDDNNEDEQNKEDNESDNHNNKNSNSTDTNDQPDEQESVIHIIESGTDDGYQKSEEENWMTECFKRGSIKDEAIIILFLGSTGVLLTYAIMKKCFANNYEDGMKYNYTTLNNNSSN